MTHLKRILISGYYGFSNTGDEAVLSAIIKGLRAQGDFEITVLSASPGETANLHNVRAVPRTSTSEVKKALRECDLLISGGGSLIQDATSLRSLLYYLWIISLAKRYRRKVMILGQGIGPLRRGISRQFVRRVLNGVNLVTVRDAQSAELLRELGICKPPITVTADPTFLLDPCSADETEMLLSEAGISEHDSIIVVSLREWPPHLGGLDIEKTAAEALGEIAHSLPAKLLLITMQSPSDELLAKQIHQAVHGLAVQPRPWSAQELLGVLGRCRLVVAMRLHALIFASAVGTPCLGIEYDPKVEQFLTASNQEGITLDETAAGLLPERTRKAWESRDDLASRLQDAIPAMRQAASENFRLAAELLRS